jgi:hypothetical protein
MISASRACRNSHCADHRSGKHNHQRLCGNRPETVVALMQENAQHPRRKQAPALTVAVTPIMKFDVAEPDAMYTIFDLASQRVIRLARQTAK